MLGRLPCIMLFIVRQLTFLRVCWIASLFGCFNVVVYLSGSKGFPTFAHCLEHICAGGGGGGSVANMGFISLCRRGL